MGKHRLRNRVKSIVETLIDPVKDEQLKDSNTETEENYKKILEMVNDNDQEDKNKLVNLIEEFHNRYKSIYERYDQITGKLNEKNRSKKEKNSSSSSSSSSDSDSNNSSSKVSKNGKLKEKIHMTVTEIDELQRKLAVETEEKETLNLKLQETVNMLNESKLESERLIEENIKLLAENRELDLKLKATEDEVSNLIQKLESLELENKSLFQKLDEQKTEFEQQKDEEFMVLEKKFEEKIDNLLKKLESISTQKQESDNLIECLREEIKNKNLDQERLLKENDVHVAEINQLESDLEVKGDEVNTLTETIRNLEVKIRLSTQKLRVTEQTLNETEHEHATKEEKLHQENKSLVEKISTLSQTIADIKREVQEKVNETLTGVDSLTVKFEEDYGHVTTRVNKITNEIQAGKIQLKQTKELTKRNFEEIVTKLKLSEIENHRLVKSLEDTKTGSSKKDVKINELENAINVKDEWILSFCEDKREAIKQLCIWADYHRDRFDHLQQLLKTRR